MPTISRGDVDLIRIDSEHTKGAGHARNVGMKKALGKWLLFADCDDYYEEGFLNVLDQYRDSPQDIVFFNFTFVDGTSGKPFPDRKLQILISGYDGSKEQGDYIRYRNNTPWAKMVRTEYVKSHNMYFEEVRNGNDVLFSLFVASYSNRFAVEPSRLYNYVRTPNSIGTKTQSVDDLKCRIDHHIKHAFFNSYLGHPEWNGSLFRFLLQSYSRIGLAKFVHLAIWTLYCCVFCRQSRREWVDLIESHR